MRGCVPYLPHVDPNNTSLPMRTLLLILVIAVAGCRVGEKPETVAVRSDLLVSPEWLADNLNDVVVLHVGPDSSQYMQGHVPGARFMSVSGVAVDTDVMLNALPSIADLEMAFEAVGISDDSHVILYGDMNGLAAARAFYALDVLGHDQKALLDGGLAGWQASGGALSTDVPTRRRGNITSELKPYLVVDAPTVNNRRSRSRTLLIDARPFDQFTGDKPGSGIERPGHIPRAVSLYWAEDLTDEGKLVAPDSLFVRYAQAGVDSTRQIIAYCRTGMQSSFTYFVLRYLGFNPLMYDGSYYDWSNNTRYPIATGAENDQTS